MFLKRLILLEPPDPTVAETLTQIAGEFNLLIHRLAGPPPVSDSELAAELMGAVAAVIYLDRPEKSTPWLKCLNRSNGEIPIIGLFTIKAFAENHMEELFKASALGLDALVPLPLDPAFAREQLLRFFDPVKLNPASVQKKIENLDAPEPRLDSIKSHFLAGASPQNQLLLQTLEENLDARSFCVRGRPGCELSLLSQEVGLRLQMPVEIIYDSAEHAIQTSRKSLKNNEARCLLHFIPLGEATPEALSEMPALLLEPLQQRPADLAHYAATWLPKLIRAGLPPNTPFLFPEALGQRLLAHTWPGEFSELWRCLQRIALAPSRTVLPPPLSSAPDVDPPDVLCLKAAQAAFTELIRNHGSDNSETLPASEFSNNAND